MSKLFRTASRGLVLAALSFLLAVSPEGNAQNDRPAKQIDRRETAKKVARLTAALKDRSYWPNQYGAAEELGQLGSAAKDAVPALIAALKDPEHNVRYAAARALDKIGAITPEVLVALKSAAKDKTPLVRDAAMEAYESLLGKASKNDLPELVAALKETEPSVRRDAVRLLGEVGAISPEALAALKAAKKDKDPDLRRVAVEAYKRAYERLMGKATRYDVPTLVVALKDSEPFVRRAAARALGKVGAIATSPDALAALKAAMKDNDPGVRRAATETLDRNSSLVEPYLLQGRLAEGEAALLERLKVSPQDDQAHFGLGMLRFVRGVERLGQSLHKYGCQSEKTNIPFLRLPVPVNPDPAPISYADFRRMLDVFRRDLSAAEATLAGVTDDKVKLPLHIAAIRLDLVSGGKPTDEFCDILKRIVHLQQFGFQESNPDFLVCFDRGDVAWLRAYCHLLMAMLDFYLAFDTEQLFDLWADEVFARPKRTASLERTTRGGRRCRTREG